MLQVETDRDCVLLVFAHRGRDLCLPPDSARTLVQSLRIAASDCETWVNAGGAPRLFTGEVFEIQEVKSWDGKVNIRFDRDVQRVPIPFHIARVLASVVQEKIWQAENSLTIEFKNG